MKSNINRKYTLNEEYFREINTPEKAYFLGLMYSDGSVSDRSIVISLQERDGEILKKLAKLLDYNGPVTTYSCKNINHSNKTVLRVYSREFVQDLTKIGCKRNKTYDLKLPILPELFYSHFIRGVFDGDGCIMRKGKNSYYFSITGNKEFLEQIEDIIINQVSIKRCKISTKNKSNNIFGAIQHSANADLLKIRDYIYNDCKNLFIDRKKQKFDEIVEKIIPTCKCGKKHFAKGFCNTCYSRELVYKKIKPKIEVTNTITYESILFNNLSDVSKYVNIHYDTLWRILKGTRINRGIHKYKYI